VTEFACIAAVYMFVFAVGNLVTADLVQANEPVLGAVMTGSFVTLLLFCLATLAFMIVYGKSR
jgi:hypothetical protein